MVNMCGKWRNKVKKAGKLNGKTIWQNVIISLCMIIVPGTYIKICAKMYSTGIECEMQVPVRSISET